MTIIYIVTNNKRVTSPLSWESQCRLRKQNSLSKAQAFYYNFNYLKIPFLFYQYFSDLTGYLNLSRLQD